MLSYLKSEFYRLYHNKWSYLFIVICSALLISSNIVLAAVKAAEPGFPYATTYFALSCFYTSFQMVFLLCISVAALVFGNEHSNHTMKNSVSYGISRGNIYFGKLIVEMVYAVIAFVIITGIDIAAAYLLLENSGVEHLHLLIKACFVAMPMFLCALAVTNCFLFALESTGAAVSAIIGLLVAFPLVSNFLGMKFKVFAEISRFLPLYMINNITYDFKKAELILPWDGIAGYYYYWLVGLAELIVVALIGFLVFRKKEVK